jgi:hypothetical protein
MDTLSIVMFVGLIAILGLILHSVYRDRDGNGIDDEKEKK